jgi:photosystem II stability/assembly factor-like uncharacterized protein
MRRFALSLLLLAPVLAFSQIDPSTFGGLRYRLLGPFRGGRALAVTGVPGQPEKYYFGAVGGGVWESDNAGRTWKPIFDGQPTASIGAMAVAPSDPNVIYVGTGEADMRSDIQQGDGMYRSLDAGKTWQHIGLIDSRQIGKILVDLKDAQTVYVAALGHQYGPNDERGVFKSTDGGASWTKVLGKGSSVGAIDLAMDPGDSKTIYATMWSTRRPPWSVYPPSNGPGGGIYKSVDGGSTWVELKGHGFPAFVGRVGISVSPTDGQRIYACVDTNDRASGGIYRSDDAGASWTKTDGDGRLWGRGWYFCGITSDPKDPNTVYVMNTSTYRSTDGGKTFTAIKGAPGGDDYHTMWILPEDPSHMILGCDQGVVVSVDGAQTWSSWYNQPTAQLYHIVTDNRFPYWVYGSQQDSGAIALPSRTIHTGINAQYSRPIEAGGESGTIAPDPLHQGMLLSSTGDKEDIFTAWNQSIDPTLEHEEADWRSEWTQPIVSSPADPKVFYMSHQNVFRTGDAGASWQMISPDLTRPTHTTPDNLDSVTAEDKDPDPQHGVVFWLAPSPVQKRLLWAGTDDGLLWLTRDDGAHWSNVSPPELQPWSKVAFIDAGHFSADTAYAVIDKHRLDDNHPYIYRTHDGGRHWESIVNGLPDGQFVNVVREDPLRAGLLYAGTDWGVFVSFDDGDHWQSLQLNLPAASVRDVVFGANDIVIGTHGRSIWVLDDATRLRQMHDNREQLFAPADACLFQRAGAWGFGLRDEGTPLPPEEPQGENAPWGAVFDYVLSGPAKLVTLTIADEKGRTVRTISSSDQPRKFNPDEMDIPAYWIKTEPGLGWEAGGHRYVWDLQDTLGPIVPPGWYTVTLKADGQSFSQQFKVVRDPRLPVTDADLRSQFAMQMAVLDEIARVQAAMGRAKALDKAGASSARLKELLTVKEGGTPDMMFFGSHDPRSLPALIGDLSSVEGAVSSAPGAPTPLFVGAFAKLKAAADRDIADLDQIEKTKH